MRWTLVFFLATAWATQALAQSSDRANLNQSEGKATYSTNLDFDSTMIDGQAKAPMGFFLQGRNKQSLSNMVKLRSDFKPELKRSKTAVKAMVR